MQNYIIGVLVGIEETCVQVTVEFTFAAADNHWWCLYGQVPCHSHTLLKVGTERLQLL